MPLLELLPPDQTGGGYGSRSGLFSSDKILGNIAPQGRIDGGEGIPSIWWEVWFAKWALYDHNSPSFKPANELLRLFVLLQFLGLLKPKILSSDHSGFRRLISIMREQDPAKESWPSHFRDPEGKPGLVVLWTLQGDGRIVAGSHPEMLFFPSAALTAEHVQELKLLLVQRAGALLEGGLVTGDPPDPFALQNPTFVRAPRFAKGLVDYLARLVGTTTSPENTEPSEIAVTDSSAGRGEEWRRALNTWKTELENGTKGLALSVPAVPTGLRIEHEKIEFALWPDPGGDDRPLIWNCPRCAGNRRVWTEKIEQVEINSASSGLRCPVHPEEWVRKGDGVSNDWQTLPKVDWRDLGACLVEGKLYIWTDDGAWPQSRTADSEVFWDAGEIRHHFGPVTVKLRGRLLRLDDILLNSTPWLTRIEEEPPEPMYAPLVGDFAHLLDRCDHDAKKWMIHFKGRRNPVPWPLPPVPPVDNIKANLWGTSTILIWPPLSVPNWNRDYVAASTSRGERARYRVLYLAKDQATKIGGPLKVDELYRFDGKIKYLELGQLDGLSFRSFGLIEARSPKSAAAKPAGESIIKADGSIPSASVGASGIDRSSIASEADAHGTIVLDFGTSNSAVLWRAPGSINNEFLKAGIREQALLSSSCRVSFAQQHYSNLCKAIAVLMDWYCDAEQKTALTEFVPSVLAVPKSEQASPTIPPRKIALDLLKYPGGAVLYPDLKWKENWDAPKVEALIELLLLPALWSLRELGAESWSLVATYPLAFDELRRKNYRETLQRVSNRLAGQTGMRLKVAQPTLRSESLAGAKSFLEEARLIGVTLDLGGGTLDTAVFLKRQCGNLPPGHFIAFDSFRYGGQAFLRAALSSCKPILPAILGLPVNDKWEEMLKFGVELLESEIQSVGHLDVPGIIRASGGDVKEFWKTYADNCRPQIFWRAEALIAGMMLYLRRVIEGTLKLLFKGDQEAAPEVTFYLLGQGWQLLPAMLNSEGSPDVRGMMDSRIRRVYETVIASRQSGRVPEGISARIAVEYRASSAKTAVAAGAATLDSEGATEAVLLHPVSQKPVRRSFVGMDLYKDRQPILEASREINAVPLRERGSDLAELSEEDLRRSYKILVDELFGEIVNSDTQKKVRELFGKLPDSQNIVGSGQNMLIKNWRVEQQSTLTESLLTKFLEEVWCKLWSENPA